MVGKRLVNTVGAGGAAAFDPLQNFETVTYTGNGTTQKITGYIRKGAAFNGSSSLIDTGISNSTLPVSSAWSVSVFFYANSNIGGDIVLSLEDATINGWSIYVAWNGSTNVIYPAVNGVSPSGSYGSVANNTWTNVVLTFDGSSTMKMYQDGSLIDTYTSVSISSPTTNLRIGKGGFGANWDGKIDQVRIFNAELNLTQAGQLADEEYGDAKNSVTDFFGNGSGVALYQLDEDANSSNFEQAAVFNGSSSRINTGYQLPSGLSGFSVSAWVKAASVKTQYIVGDLGTGGASADGMFQINISSSNVLRASVGGAASQTIATISNYIDTWTHIVVTTNSSGNIIGYVNGSQVGTASGNSLAANTRDFVIGMFGDINSTSTFDGSIDQVRIYDTELDSGDVTKLYNESADVPTANLIAHYKLDGNATDATETYDGTASNVTYSAGVYGGTPTNVNFLGMAFKPDFVWVKNRDDTEQHGLFDSVRGADKWLHSETTQAEQTYGGGYGITSFDSNGFTIGNGTAINAPNESIVAWCWRAAGAANTYNVLEGGTVTSDSTASGAGITAGTITTGWEVSANRDAGFSIVKYTGGNSASDTVGHGLTDVEMIILKDLTDGTNNWRAWHKDLSANHWMYLNLTLGEVNAAIDGGIRKVDSDTFGFINGTTGGVEGVNSNASDYIAYCFHSVDSYQRVGSYTGASGLRVYTTDDGTSTGNGGFQPRFLMVKKTSGTANWVIIDSVRVNGIYEDILFPNTTDAEAAGNYDELTFNSDGFTWNQTENTKNAVGGEYIYLAIA